MARPPLIDGHPLPNKDLKVETQVQRLRMYLQMPLARMEMVVRGSVNHSYRLQ
jgi:hypothetical protein